MEAFFFGSRQAEDRGSVVGLAVLRGSQGIVHFRRLKRIENERVNQKGSRGTGLGMSFSVAIGRARVNF